MRPLRRRQTIRSRLFKRFYENEPDDYNYVAPTREVDDAEIRSLSAVAPETSVDKRVYMASVLFFICALIGASIGYAVGVNADSKASVERVNALGNSAYQVMKVKSEQLESLRAAFEKISGDTYVASGYEREPYQAQILSKNFMMDIAGDLSAEIILLGDAEKGDVILSKLREYSAKSILLQQLLTTHGIETRAESESIIELQNKGGDAKVVYALQVIPDALYYLSKDAPRYQYANGIVGIYTYRNVIEEDQELSDAYSQLKVDNRWSELQRARRDYKPEDRREMAAIEAAGLDLPNRYLYDVTDRRGDAAKLFADELILVDRNLFFGDSENAKQRFDHRSNNIKELIAAMQKDSSELVSALKKYDKDKK